MDLKTRLEGIKKHNEEFEKAKRQATTDEGEAVRKAVELATKGLNNYRSHLDETVKTIRSVSNGVAEIQDLKGTLGFRLLVSRGQHAPLSGAIVLSDQRGSGQAELAIHTGGLGHGEPKSVGTPIRLSYLSVDTRELDEMVDALVDEVLKKR